MYNRSFFQTKLGHASLASVSAMVLFVALASQIQSGPAFALVHSDMHSDRAPALVAVEVA